MGAPTVSKYDIYLGDKAAINGYRTRQLVRDSAPLIASKFSTGSQGQTDLSLNKVETVSGFSGGMFQRSYGDLSKAARIIGVYNKFTDSVFPTPARSSLLTNTIWGSSIAKAEDSQNIFVGAGSYTTGFTSYLHKAAAGATVFTDISLPAAFGAGSANLITGLCVHRGYLYIGAQLPSDFYPSPGNLNCHRMKISDNTFQDIGGYLNKFATLRGVLYGFNNIGGIWSVTNEFAAGAATYTLVDNIGSASCCYDMVEFNGALWISKPDGLFRFDGVKGVKVLNLVIPGRLQVFNGAIYFKVGKWLYKFDGTNVTQLQFMDETLLGMTASTDYLFFSTAIATGTYTTDKSGAQVGQYYHRLYAYDGVAFFMFDERVISAISNTMCNLYLSTNILFDNYVDGSDVVCYTYDLATLYNTITTASKLDITTSEYDGGFPAVYKSLDSIELGFSGIVAGDSIAVLYSYDNGSGWSAWQTAGTITSTTSNKIEIVDDTKKLFKNIKFNVIVTPAAGSTLAYKSISWSYTLQPRIRWRWQGVLIAYGNTIIDRLGAATTQSANTLNNLITKSIKQKTPVYLLTPDYTVVKTTANAAATSIVLQGEPPIYTDPYGEYPMVAIKNASDVWEILRVLTATYASATDQTTIVVEARGYLGITAAELTAGKEVHICHKVYVTRLIRDSVELNDETYDEQSTKATQLKREFNIELTEV